MRRWQAAAGRALAHRIRHSQLVAPCAIAFLDAECIDRVVAAIAQINAVGRRRCRVQLLVKEWRALCWHVELPTELTDVGHACGAQRDVAHADLARGAEGEAGIVKGDLAEALQQLARLGAHERQHCYRRGDVGQRKARA